MHAVCMRRLQTKLVQYLRTMEQVASGATLPLCVFVCFLHRTAWSPHLLQSARNVKNRQCEKKLPPTLSNTFKNPSNNTDNNNTNTQQGTTTMTTTTTLLTTPTTTAAATKATKTAVWLSPQMATCCFLELFVRALPSCHVTNGQVSRKERWLEW